MRPCAMPRVPVATRATVMPTVVAALVSAAWSGRMRSPVLMGRPYVVRKSVVGRPRGRNLGQERTLACRAAAKRPGERGAVGGLLLDDDLAGVLRGDRVVVEVLTRGVEGVRGGLARHEEPG